MKKLVLVLAVVFSGFINAQPDLDSLSKLPFYNCITTKEDLKAFDFKKVYDLDNFSELLSIRYGCVVVCDHFLDMNDYTDVAIYLRPFGSDMYECSVMTLLSIAENFFNRGILLDNVNLYYEICKTTSPKKPLYTQEIFNGNDSMFLELKFRRELGGYVPDKNEKFEPVLKKLIEGRLDIDSLELKQPALNRICVNEDFKGGKHIDVLTYLRNFEVDKYKDTSKFDITYRQFDLREGDRQETLIIFNNETSEYEVILHLQFETYSNLIYDLISEIE
jgi:hypothetical protein